MKVKLVNTQRVGISKTTPKSILDIMMNDGTRFKFDDVVNWSRGQLEDLTLEQKDELIQKIAEYFVASISARNTINSQQVH